MNVREALDNIYKEFEKSYEEAKKEGYNAGLEDGNISDGTFDEKVKEAYENGLNDVWECVNKMYSNMDPTAIESIFGVEYYDVFEKFTASEAIEKIKKYEETNIEIKLGDEVESCGAIGVVVESPYDGGYDNEVLVLWANSAVVAYKKRDLKKTGRHFLQIEEVLQKMQEGEA